MTHSVQSEGMTIHADHGDLINGYLDHLRFLRRSPKTVRTYAVPLRLAHDQLPAGLPSATKAEIQTWLGRTRTAQTQRTYSQAVRGFFAWAVQEEHLDFDPVADLPLPKVGKRLPRPARYEQIVAVLNGTTGNVLTWSMLAVYAGLRCAEAGSLSWDHVDLSTDTLYVVGKGDKERWLPLSPALHRHLSSLDALPRGSGDSIASATRYAYYKLGVQTSMHRLRSYAANSMLRNGTDLATVQEFLGHESPATTKVYASPSEQQIRAAVAGLPDVTGDAE